MNNYILLDRCFAETTPESCEDGDFSRTGMIEKDQPYSFRELVDMMKQHPDGSRWPDDMDIDTCYSTGFYIADYSTCTSREETIHFSQANTPNAEKYWKRARILASFKK